MNDEPAATYPTTSALIAAEAPDFPSFLVSEKEPHRSGKPFRKGGDGRGAYAGKCDPAPTSPWRHPG